MSKTIEIDDLATVPYIGGSSFGSSEAILDCLSHGDALQKARLLSSPHDKKDGTRRHGFFLSFETLGYFIVPRGYASGYGGTGPNQLSRMLLVLQSYGVYPKEIILDAYVFERLQKQCLTHDDFDLITKPNDFHCDDCSRYILGHNLDEHETNAVLPQYKPRLPLALLHPSIQDLKQRIFSDPEDALRQGYIRIESKVRKISESNQHGTKLFDDVLKPRIGTLQLKNLEDEGEQAGVQNFIKGVFQLYRNPLMHREISKAKYRSHSAISEFLVVNHILHLCDELEERPEKIDVAVEK